MTGQIQLEHVHRYLVAREYAKDKDVLDIASGEGFGSEILADSARSVVGVDISVKAVRHATNRYHRDNLQFRHGSCAEIPLDDNSVDLVVSFETIEHHDEHKAMMAEIKRVLRPGGVLIISSPDRKEYSILPNYHNPFHVRELFKEEFEDLIRAYFKNVALMGQRVVYGSGIFPVGRAVPHIGYDIKDTSRSHQGLVRPRYLIAFASDEALPVLLGGLLEQTIEESENVRDHSAVIAQLEDKNRQLEEQANSQTARSAEEVRRLEERLHSQKQLCESMTNSLSWRLTRPLRVLRDALVATVKKLRRHENLPLHCETRPPTERADLREPDDPALLVNLLYKAALGRLAKPEDLAQRVHQLQSGVSPQALAEEIVASPEFQTRHGTSQRVDMEFLTRLYRDGLGRESDPEGLAHWLVEGEEGATREKVLSAFAGSAEARTSAVANSERQIVQYRSDKNLDLSADDAPQLSGSTGGWSRFYSLLNEIYPVNAARSSASCRRLNILIPTVKPDKIYGGVASALKCAKALRAAIGAGWEVRVIVTSDEVDAPSMQEIAKRLTVRPVLAEPNDDVGGTVVVDLKSRKHLPLALRAGDVFFATAWWTADLAFRLQDRQKEMFGGAASVVYMIQDYEPGFYPWSDRYAAAGATYLRGNDTIALINSEELANFMTARYHFAHAFCIPFAIDQEIAAHLRPTVKQKKILAYGRPSVPRNLFETIVESARVWQGRNPEENCTYEIVFAGEAVDSSCLGELENARAVGKLSLKDYALQLNEAAIGISIMISPHPSYPPLEMAAAGCVTITNRYDQKDLSRRADNIISLDEVTPGTLADALNVAISRVRLNATTPLAMIRDIQTGISRVDYHAVATLL
jgi:SAM-dependent methyltransferase